MVLKKCICQKVHGQRERKEEERERESEKEVERKEGGMRGDREKA